MRMAVLMICLLMGSGSNLMAEDALVVSPVHTIVGGVVKSITWADPVKNTKSEIVVRDAKGKIVHILVTATTTLWDAYAKGIMPDKIAVRNHVNIIYVTSEEGVLVAKSIKVLG